MGFIVCLMKLPENFRTVQKQKRKKYILQTYCHLTRTDNVRLFPPLCEAAGECCCCLVVVVVVHLTSPEVYSLDDGILVLPHTRRVFINMTCHQVVMFVEGFASLQNNEWIWSFWSLTVLTIRLTLLLGTRGRYNSGSSCRTGALIGREQAGTLDH